MLRSKKKKMKFKLLRLVNKKLKENVHVGIDVLVNERDMYLYMDT